MLTDTKLRTLKPGKTMYRLADRYGLSVEVPTTGALRWRFRYRFDGKAIRLGDLEIATANLPDSLKLPGLSLEVRPLALKVGDAMDDICCLLKQMNSVVYHETDLSPHMWVAIQQLALVEALFEAIQNTVHGAKVLAV